MEWRVVVRLVTTGQFGVCLGVVVGGGEGMVKDGQDELGVKCGHGHDSGHFAPRTHLETVSLFEVE